MEEYSQCMIAKKLKISWHGVQYMLKRKQQTGNSFDRKRAGKKKATAATEDRFFVTLSKRN